MKIEHDDSIDQLGHHVAQALNDSVHDIDAATLSKLNQARQKAMNTSQPRWSMKKFTAAAAMACTMVIAVLVTQQPWRTDAPATMADVNMNILQEDVEMLEDLEMLYWLVEQEGRVGAG